MATKKLYFSMAYKTVCGWLLGLLCVGVIFVASGTWAKCSDQTFNSACICLDDIECVTSFDVFEPTVCKCHDLGDVSLDGLIEVFKETSGVVDALHISGHELNSLEPLAGLLKEVRHSIVILNTALQSLKPLAGLDTIGKNLSMVDNKFLRNVDGLGNITQVTGSLGIMGNANLTDVDGLGNITQVNGDLQIGYNDALTDVDGLGNINQVNGSLWIGYNDALTSVDGLGNITQVNGSLWIGYNDALTSVDGLGSITQVNGDLRIEGNDALTGVDGLGSITQVNGGLWIGYNDGLTGVDGLGNITQVNGDLWIESNGALTSVDGLGGITQVNGGLWIGYNDALIGIDGLGNITQVNGDLWIESNDALIGVDGLGSITQVKGGLWIGYNDALTGVDGLGNITQVNGNLGIFGNANLTDVDSLGNIIQVNGDLQIGYNDALTGVDGLGNITQVNGSLWIGYNDALSGVDGLGSITQVNGDLRVEGNDALTGVDGLGSITQVNGDLRIESNDALTGVDGLSNITQVNGDLQIGYNDALTSVDGLGSIAQVNGDLRIEGNDALFDVVLPSLVNIGGSLVLEGNRLRSLSFSNLEVVCSNAIGRCSLTIHNNRFLHYTLSTFYNLRGNLSGHLCGHLSITSNLGLGSIQGFDSLISLKGDKSLREEGLTISSNPDLDSVDGFGSLARVEGDVAIDSNENLQYVSLKSLAIVDGTTRVTSNGEQIEDFVSRDPLPYRQEGCRKWESMSPMSSAFVVSERLVKKVCVLETLTPTLVGFAIIGLLVLMSLLLLYYLAVTISSPYKERIPLDTVKDMFASHLLALADVLSDVGFIVTVFILWDSKSKKGVAGVDITQDGSYTKLLAIGVASIVVVVVSKLSAVFLVFWCLRTKRADEDETGKRLSLMDHLKEGKRMQTHDWLLLFPGLLLLDVEIIKHLPWGEELEVDGDRVVENGGIPHKHFAWAAYLAALLEDLPQVVLQVAFIIVIEEDDGWAITGAMASLTLSIADVMVKLVFPPLLQQLMGCQHGLKHANAMKKRCEHCDQLLPQKKLVEQGLLKKDSLPEESVEN